MLEYITQFLLPYNICIIFFIILEFAIEYRCAGSRSGQFFLTLFFNVSWPSEKDFTSFSLKQEKICATRDGRRALSGNNLSDEVSSHWALTQHELIYFSIALFSAIALLSILLICFSYNITHKNTNGRLSPKIGAGAAAHSFYAAAATLKSGGASSTLLP